MKLLLQWLRDRRSGVLVEVNIQTDFAARNEDFRVFVRNVVGAAATAPEQTDLGSLVYPAGGGSIDEVRQGLIGKLGENIALRRWCKMSSDAGLVHSYVHMGGKIGVLLALNLGDSDKATDTVAIKFADDTAMQIAAMAPLYLTVSDIPDEARAKQTEIFEAQLSEEGKPAAARPKIIEGKIAKWAKEVCLLEQASVLEVDKTIDQIRADLSNELGTDVTIKGFVRYLLGEGIEKQKGDDFATEVMKMSQS